MGRQASSRIESSGQPLIGHVDLVLHRESNIQPVCSYFQMKVAFYCVTGGESRAFQQDMDITEFVAPSSTIVRSTSFCMTMT